MKNKQNLVASILKRYGKTNDVNMTAWNYFYNQAIQDKVWAQSVGDEWKSRACQMSIEMRQEYLSTPTAILAAKHYAYSQYRAQARGKAWGLSISIDPVAEELWNSFQGNNYLSGAPCYQ